MSLVFNGIVIPENKANAFTYNGNNITNVYVNGIHVWKQSLFSAIWSGSSKSGQYEFSTSGSLFRSVHGNTAGKWLTAYNNGTFQQGSSSARFLIRVHVRSKNKMVWVTMNINSWNNALSITYRQSNGNPITFSIGSGFTGTSSARGVTLSTSGGSLRIGVSNSSPGAWIRLQ